MAALRRALLRVETEPWWRQAKADLLAAERNAEGELYYVVTWFAQQATEKALKALLVEQSGEMPPRTHDLQLLGRNLSLPDALRLDLDILVPTFDRARYPDARGTPPVDLIGADDAREHLAAAQRTLEWIAIELQSPSTQL